ncbi:MAG: prenyltransferase [Planctomycetaceae bacterium]|nr:prenyltransferase [Planctomycetaceae bacterium]
MITNSPSRPWWRIVVVTAVLVSTLGGPLSAAPRTEEQKQVDDSIVRALEYLSKTQADTGAWKTDRYGESTAITSLSVMAFMAAGHVPGEGPYGAQIEKGIRWVIDHQEDNGMLVHRRSHGPMYSHGISTLMLGEVIGMVDKSLAKPCRKALERATRLILEAQEVSKAGNHVGGWRYNPNSRDSDLSVTGWQLMALRAAKNVGCDVPAEAIDKAVEYVNKCAVRNGQGFSYQPGSGPTPTRTGTGIAALEVCGEHESEKAIAGAEYLLEHPLTAREHYFFYGVYYCSVGMFKLGGKYWEAHKTNMIEVLLENQNDDGSWKEREARAGNVYATSMAVLGLAVEYQYLPIYQR